MDVQQIKTVLRSLDCFQNIEEAALDWFIEQLDIERLPRDAFIHTQGQRIEALIIVVDAEVDIFMEQQGEHRHLKTTSAPYLTGVLPFSRMEKAFAAARVRSAATVLRFHKKHFKAMHEVSYTLLQNLVHLMSDRVRFAAQQQQQIEKMTALGKLSAGLAHELNNPASAAVRSASALRQHFIVQPKVFRVLIEAGLNTAQLDFIYGHILHKLSERVQPLGLMERTALEDELLDWFETQGIHGADDWVETFTDFQVQAADLDVLAEHLTSKVLVAALGWMHNVFMGGHLVGEIHEASTRIATLVRSIKSYAYVDRSEGLEFLNIKTGIQNTLIMLKHKLKRKQIKVDVHFAEQLPAIRGYTGELNQVWTNILDNAIDAVDNEGHIQIKAAADHRFLRVDIEDDGMGIPKEIQHKIFDPFFTTKAIGEGTGLGLDTVHRIMLKHRSEIRLTSVPGRTCFTLCFPLTD